MKTCIHDSNAPIGAFVLVGAGAAVSTVSPVCGRHGFKSLSLEPIGRHFYRCRWPECGELSPKEQWGPGRITCPACKRMAMSAAESRQWCACAGCGATTIAAGDGRQLLCRECSDKHGAHGEATGEWPESWPFNDWSFCDRCQDYHEPEAHLL